MKMTTETGLSGAELADEDAAMGAAMSSDRGDWKGF
jgi:hypothetical protein